jgi:hypothetical protein
MREPIREPVPPESQQARAPQPLRYAEPARVTEAAPYTSPGGLVEWAPTWGGIFISLAVWLLLSLLGLALGIGGGVWEAVGLFIGFLAGGWFTGRSLNVVDTAVSAMHGILVWAVSLIGSLIFSIITAISALHALTNLLGPLAGGLATGGVTVAPGVPAAAAAAASNAAASTTTPSAWEPFIVLLLGLAAAIIGALIGNQSRIPGPFRTIGR